MNNGFSNRKLSVSESITLVTSDFKLAYKISLALNPYLRVNHKTISEIDRNDNLIIISSKDIANCTSSKKIILNPDHSLLKLKNCVLKEFISDKNPNYIIGLDPGGAIGIAIILDRFILETDVVYQINGAIHWINNKINDLMNFKVVFKIGNGGGKHDELRRIILKEYGSKYKIELVDERYTSKRESKEVTIHEHAAIKIAKRHGIEFVDPNI